MIEPSLRIAPANVRQEASRRFEEIAKALEDIPSGSVFWASARVSQLCMVVHGWSFFYTLDDETLRVTEVRPG